MNDNFTETNTKPTQKTGAFDVDNVIANLNELSDAECLTLFLSFLENRITINTAFVRDDDSDIFTHQVVRIECGDYATVSHPEPLDVPLRPATGAEVGATVN